MKEVILEETKEGEMFFTIPPDTLERLRWEEGDDIKFLPVKDDPHAFMLKKIKYESVELEFEEDELFRFMQLAHEENLSFSEFVERAMAAWLEKQESV